MDILRGDVTFKRQKPQIIVFPEQTIGKTFKITPGTELEVLAKGGTIVRKQGKLGTTIINKKVIPIFEADIVKSSKNLQKLTKQARTGTISAAGGKDLRGLLAQETGFDFSGVVSTKPLISLTDIATDILIGATKIVQPSKKIGLITTSPITSKIISNAVSKPPTRQKAVRLSRGINRKVSQALTGGISEPLTGIVSAPPSGVISGISGGISGAISRALPGTGIPSIPIKPTLITKPTPPPKTFIPRLPELRFFEEKKKKKRKPLPQEFAFSGDFISSVLNQFAPQPSQIKFTGQERRFRIRGRRIAPLPKKALRPLSSIILGNFGNILGLPRSRPRRRTKRRTKR